MISKIKAILFVLTHSGQFLFIPNEWKGVIIDFSTRRAKPHELTVDEFDEIMSCDWEDVKEDGI